ncbi:hypothetical protein ASU33_02845 [Solirubrum puertoriconensis]|uniref:Uncharacterized protein n=1 Tax=Solirubrum puertoriconensis TaxID=1751427 RepID=A0A9X0HI54_SOLP1|nr:hypothetical protein ASU33_02845 [Solirubrum puertoriconensis]
MANFWAQILQRAALLHLSIAHMKSFLQFVVLLTLVILGKLVKERASTPVAIKPPVTEQTSPLQSFFARQASYTQAQASNAPVRATTVSMN